MKLINIELGDWGLGIETYLGDFYLPNRTLILAILIVVGLRVRKVLKDKKRKS